MHIVELDEAQMDDVVSMANRMTDGIIAAAGTPHSEQVADLFAGADLFWAVWQEKRAPHGVRTAIVKGIGTVRETAASEHGRALRVAAVRFRNAAEAQAACQVYGDEQAEAA
ncbi:hypothetical protein [Methylorubrum extorquens]|uniref:Uncharacterized protein n=1 Tax=Methylorubrum extorquens TaxID=408 RepID=A0AAX3WB40_METEX|nr:hypothetical protein [Methylorubrum extorquens]WHQ68667.1 hypothetical protein KEC54_20190 [Methylorubrum extorquens]